jgi:hypothetical protein
MINQLTHSREQSPSWEANSNLAGQRIPCLLCNLMAHYSIHKQPPLDHIMSQINPVSILLPLFYKMNQSTDWST